MAPITYSSRPGLFNPFSSVDGSLDPGCTVYYPTLFTSSTALPGGTNAPYAFRPPSKVAGVDYGIGPRCGTVFKIPGVDATPPGVTISTIPTGPGAGTTPTFQVGANNVVIDGWDFTVGGGWQVNAAVTVNCNNLTISNCKFKTGANGAQPIRLFGTSNFGFSGTGYNVHHNIIDGNNVDFGGNSPLLEVAWDATGSSVLYNFIGNAGCDLMDLSGTSALNIPATVIKYNLLQQNGQGAGHADFLQTAENDGATGPSPLYGSMVFDFNTLIQYSFPPLNGTQGITLDGNTKTIPTLFAGGSCSRNTILLTAAVFGNFTFVFRMANDCDAGPWQCNNNYCDPSGLSPSNGTQVFKQSVGSGPYTQSSVFCSGNINMIDGTSLDHSF